MQPYNRTDPGSSSSAEVDAGAESHLRDLNPRPTVYEGEAIKNDFNGLTPVQARSRAYEALLELAQGGHALAGALLVERLAAGDGRARTALAEVAAGRWAAAVELLEKLSQVEGDVDATG